MALEAYGRIQPARYNPGKPERHAAGICPPARLPWRFLLGVGGIVSTLTGQWTLVAVSDKANIGTMEEAPGGSGRRWVARGLQGHQQGISRGLAELGRAGWRAQAVTSKLSRRQGREGPPDCRWHPLFVTPFFLPSTGLA